MRSLKLLQKWEKKSRHTWHVFFYNHLKHIFNETINYEHSCFLYKSSCITSVFISIMSRLFESSNKVKSLWKWDRTFNQTESTFCFKQWICEFLLFAQTSCTLFLNNGFVCACVKNLCNIQFFYREASKTRS